MLSGTVTTTAPPLSGEQMELRLDDQRAVVVEVGGGLREYDVAGRQILDGYGDDEVCPAAAGAILVPWPNRVRGGRWEYDGTGQQLDLTEPGAGNAIHGLTRWTPWRLRRIDAAAATASVRIHPRPGWPLLVDVSVDWRLGPDGLTATLIAVNAGTRHAPFGCGFHPYFAVDGGASAATLMLPARRRLVLDGGVPTGETVAFAPGGGAFAVGEQVLDDCLDDLGRDERGVARASVIGADGRGAELWCDAALTHLMVFTADTLPPERRRRSVAVEPMSCPPDALRSGDGLVWLEPGGAATFRWGISRVG
jgi:aldose 1-epimerase